MLIMKDALYRVMDKDIIDGKCIIPQNIFRIKSSAFLNCKTLTEIDIPENVTIIEGSPFWECSSLKKVNILGPVTNIGELAFYGCSSLTEIGLPATVTSIGNGAFYGCSALTEISLPNGVTSIGDSIFSRCSGLKKINLPEGITSIGDNVFLGCSSLTNISLPDGVTNIGDNAFSGCSSLTEIILSNGLTSIGKGAFFDCGGLSEINLPEGVTSLGDDAFWGCSGLTKISLSNGLTSIGDRAFGECRELTEISLPESVTSIGHNVFRGCSALTKIYIPKNVLNIDYNDFNVCPNLKEITIYGEKIIFTPYDKYNQHRKIYKIMQLIRKDKLYLYRELEDLVNLIPSNELNVRERITNYISKLFDEIDLDENIEQQFDKAKQIIKLWIEKKYIPIERVCKKIPLEKIEIFDKNIWIKLIKETSFGISEFRRNDLVELAYVFGIFEKDKNTVRGTNKSEQEVDDGDRRAGNVHDYQKRLEQIVRLINEKKLDEDKLHMMFNGTNMEYNPAFYTFFLKYEQEIFDSDEIMELMPKIQREMSNMVKVFDGRIPTIEECMRYFSDIEFEGVEFGNKDFSMLCKYAGVTQEDFIKYQELYELQKKREKESTIPQIEGKNYRILDLTDPKALLIGESKFSKCCQKINGAGEDCMIHSVTSENGRLFEVFDDDGTLLAQSWMWRNGNVVCFDSIEANTLTNGKYSKAEQKVLIEKIEEAYREAAKKIIEETEKQIGIFRLQKINEINAMDITEEEKRKMKEQLERICDESRIKRVTVGEGCWEISKKISERFSDRVVDATEGRVRPREYVEHIDDSDVQYIIAELGETEEGKSNEIQSDNNNEIITNEAQIQIKYRDRRRIKKEVGTDISQSTIKKIKEIEAQSHKPQMQLMKDIGSIEGLSELLRVESKDLRIIHGEDWYYVYSNDDYGIYVFDLARGESRFEDEKMLGTREIGRGLDIIIAESIAENKPISAELREDTSYIEFLELMRSGYLEQIGDDVAVEFGAEYDDGQQISQEEQNSILERREEIRQRASKEEKTTMHFIKFKPTEKYKRVIEKRQTRENEK